jgi:hypothetical protein
VIKKLQQIVQEFTDVLAGVEAGTAKAKAGRA